MAVGTYPKRALVKVFDDDEIVRCGRFKFVNNFELNYIRGLFLIMGAIPTTQRFRFLVYSNSAYTKLLYTGEWSDFADITIADRTKTSWRGFVRGDFNNEWISNQFSYYIACEIDGYTRNANTFYIGLLFDSPIPIHTVVTADSYTDHPLAIEVFGPQKREV